MTDVNIKYDEKLKIKDDNDIEELNSESHK